MSAAESTSMKFEADSDHYLATVDAYTRASNRRAVMIELVENKLPALGIPPAMGNAAPIDSALRVLSMGAGDGEIDSKILITLRQREQRRIHAVIVDPDPLLMGRYKALTVKESEKLQGIDFEWRQETLEKFQEDRTKTDEKFHFISFFNTIYYLEDKEKSLKYLYDKLDVGGVLIITLTSGDGGFARFWRAFLEKFRRRDNLCDSYDVIKYLKNQSIPVCEIVDLKCYLNITACFASPLQELSHDGNLLLDFLTHTVGFTKKTPVELQDGVMKYLGSEDCSSRDTSGQVLLNADNRLFVIRASDQTV